MRGWALGIAAATLGILGASSEGGPGGRMEVTRAVLRTRWDSLVRLDGNGSPEEATADVDLAGLLPAGLTLEGGPEFFGYNTPPAVSVEVLLDGRSIFSEDEDVTLYPTRRKGVWAYFPPVGTGYAPYSPWLRARLDLRRETFRFRTRYVDHAVMDGDPAAVPLVVRLGDRTLRAAVEFTAVAPDRWLVFPVEPARFPRGAR